MSREWAEKQKKKQSAAKQAAQKTEDPAAGNAEPLSLEAVPEGEMAVAVS